MADSTTPQIPIPTFNLNLEPSADVVSPVIPEETQNSTLNTQNWWTDDRLQKEDKLVEGAVVESKPIVVDLPVSPVIEEKPVEIKIEAPIIEEIKPVVIETPAPVVTEKTVVVEAKPATPTPTDLQKDMEIIQNIQKETNQEPVETKPAVVNTVAEMPKIPAANSLNLDDIKVDIPKIPVAPQIAGITTPPVITIPQNPYDNLQKIIPQIAPGAATVTHKGFDKAKGISIGVTIGFLILSRFTIKTMYPIQYQDALNSVFGVPEDTGASISAALSGSQITGDLLWLETNTGDVLSGTVLSGDILSGAIATGSIDSGTVEVLTWDHSAATDTGSATSLDIATNTPSITTMSIDEFKAKIETYNTEWKLTILKAKQSKNADLVKTSLAFYKKSQSVLQDIANSKEITTDEMNTIIAELDGYLHQKAPSTDGSTTPTETPSTTGTSDFNPDAFFWTNGSK